MKFTTGLVLANATAAVKLSTRQNHIADRKLDFMTSFCDAMDGSYDESELTMQTSNLKSLLKSAQETSWYRNSIPTSLINAIPDDMAEQCRSHSDLSKRLGELCSTNNCNSNHVLNALHNYIYLEA